MRSSRLLIIAALLLAGPTHAQDLRSRVSSAQLQQAFPGAEEVGAPAGTPPAAPVRIGGALVGYVFSTRDTVRSTGYGGTPVDLLGGIDLHGRITGAAILEEHESIVDRGVSRTVIDAFLAGFATASLNDWRGVRADQAKGATTSARLMKGGMQAAARLVASDRLPPPPVQQPTLDRGRFERAEWPDLLQRGAVVHRSVSAGEIRAAFREIGASPTHAFADDDLFLDVYVALATPPAIGANLLGLQRFTEAVDRQGDDGLTLWLSSAGRFPYASTRANLLPTGFFADTVRLVQDGRVVELRPSMLRQLRAVGGNELDERDAALVFVPAQAGLDPLRPWAVEILVPGRTASGEPRSLTVAIPYALPAAYVLQPPAAGVEPPPWADAWSQNRLSLLVLALLLTAVTAVFLLLQPLTQRPRVYRFTRLAVLSVTLGWLGWWAGAQFSVVHVLALLQAPFLHTPQSAFLAEPLVLVLTVYVGLAVLLLGRGVFCGWLCPFGALQELSNHLAQALRVPQLSLPRGVRERAAAIKYIAVVVVAGTAILDADAAARVTEIEPFRTAISAHFLRASPYVAYAAALLAVGLFVERFYCRFLCPLGAALAVVGRLHMLDWLRRRPQCGTECRICEGACPVGAIGASGAIDMNECLQCLDCQVAYHDDARCPPLVRRRQRRAASRSAQALTV
jgi:NosR/NirI family nitrous oxide reductase transcriptional regulator